MILPPIPLESATPEWWERLRTYMRGSHVDSGMVAAAMAALSEAVGE